jgi:hypothetical protein
LGGVHARAEIVIVALANARSYFFASEDAGLVTGLSSEHIGSLQYFLLVAP